MNDKFIQCDSAQINTLDLCQYYIETNQYYPEQCTEVKKAQKSFCPYQ